MPTIKIRGKTLGSCVLNNFLVLFTHDESTDRIYRIDRPDDVSKISNTAMLFEGNLNFNYNNKIQTLPFYENESIQKVYWIDGLNQPRVINIAESVYNNSGSSRFDFVQELELNESVNITKQYGGGSFKSGVIQYAFTYFNKNGAESNIFYITPINYVSPVDRAGKVDEIVNNTFKIELNGIENKFEYVRIYSIHRTSIDTTPEVKSLIDLKIGTSNSLMFIDNGNYGSIVSSDLLLYIGGEELVPRCMSQKNNTLFLGNIKLIKNDAIPSSLNLIYPNSSDNFSWVEDADSVLESIQSSSDTSYPYRPKSLSDSDKIRHFKFDETYRLGIQGQYSNGKWSTPIWLGIDKTVDKRYSIRYSEDLNYVLINKIKGVYTVNSSLYNQLNNLNSKFVKVRPVMVPLKNSDRTIIAQGILSNTLATMKNRLSGNVRTSYFSYPDYLFRTETETKQTYPAVSYNGRYCHFDLLKINNNFNRQSPDAPNIHIENMANYDAVEFHDIYSPDPSNVSGGALNGNFDRDLLFIDKNTVNFWSPEITHNYDSINSYINSVKKVGLYGFSFPTGLNFNFSIDSGVELDIKNTTTVLENYDNSTLTDGWDYKKGILSTATINGAQSKLNFPMWTPEHYDDSDKDIQFTKLLRSSNVYFGINSNLSDNSYRYELNINSPNVLINDLSIFYSTNQEDSSGSILYSKNVDKSYPGGSYKNLKSVVGSVNYTDFANYGLSMKYNTASHAIFSFKKNGGYFSTMPRLENTIDYYDGYVSPELFDKPYYRTSTDKYSCDVIPLNSVGNNYRSYNSLPIFDMYSDVISDPANPNYSKYGGNTDDALFSNNWIPCGPAKKLTPGVVIDFTDGDTYIQRFDLLRVFPNDINQIPQHNEVISFICESFVNLDGRSDVNRYNTDSSLMTQSNYGLLNNIYSQKNNYFNYNILDPELFNTTNYKNTIVWTSTKVSDSINDSWTNLNMLNSIDLDGTYGEVSSLNIFNNDLYAFQPKGVARLLFNERVQQQASDGVSVELTNGYKVPEYRYLSNQYGASNKWSIIEGKQGIYFVDYINKSLISIGDGIKDLGLSLGFKSWFNENAVGRDFNLSYDRVNNDLYIHDDTDCLNYSETLGSFVSFFDYINVPQMKNVWDSFISIGYSEAEDESDVNKSIVWLHNKGDYNMFYGVQKPFSVEYLVNPEPLSDKVFNTLEYRLNDQFIDWNSLEIANWYQYGELNDRQYLNSLKRKFNVNRVQLPRQSKTLDNSTGLVMIDTRNSLNRIRSTWAKLKLSHNKTDININKKFDMQDLTVTYTI